MAVLEGIERRRSYRVNVPDAVVRCATSSTVAHYPVEDLSIGGALLGGEPAVPVGTPVELCLALPGQAELVVDGFVLRVIGERSPRFAVVFDALSPDDEDLLEETISLEYERAHNPVTLIAGPDTTGLREALAATGRPALSARSPLEVIHCLERSDYRIHTVVIGHQVGAVQGAALASFLWDAYPRVRRVYAVAAPRDRVELPPGLVHAVLRPPYAPRCLRRVFGAARPVC